MALISYLFPALLVLKLSSTAVATSEEDLKILNRIYTETSGHDWRDSSGWNPESDDTQKMCEEWVGVECDVNFRVRSLHLINQGMKGRLPTDGDDFVFGLLHLEELLITDSPELEVEFTHYFEDLKKLDKLTLRNVGIRSMKDIDFAPSTLTHLEISENLGMLTGTIPEAFWKYDNSIEVLWLQKNSLNGTISSSIEKLVNLTKFDVHHNMLTGELPPSIGGLSQLKVIAVGDNYLSGPIPDLNGLSQIEELYMSGNDFTGALEPFDELRYLNTISLQDNRLTGKIPETFLKLRREAHPEQHMTIKIGRNELNGTIPAILGDFKKLIIHAEDNKFTGFDDELNCDDSNKYGQWNEGWVDVYGCEAILCPVNTHNEIGRREEYEPCLSCFHDEHPVGSTFLGSTTCNVVMTPAPTFQSQTPAPHPPSVLEQQKTILWEMYSALGGDNWYHKYGWGSDDVSICDWYGVICGSSGAGITKLNLKDNNLSGELPSTVFELENLTELNLHDNEHVEITDQSLDSLHSSSRLTHLILAKVKFLDPEKLKYAENLTYLDISENAMTGSIPESLFNLKNLIILFLQKNEFTGTIPTEINELTHLEELDLSENRLQGQLLVTTFNNLQKMGHLKLRDNNLTGPVSNLVFDHMSRMVQLLLDKNSFTGSLPSLDFATNLAFLDVSYNKLTGTIPESFLSGKEDDDLLYVDLSHNAFDGTVPSDLGRFRNIEIDLGSNHFDAFANDLCASSENNHWLDSYATCNFILCPSGTYNEFGREKEGSSCHECNNSTHSALYLGSTSCSDNSDDVIYEEQEFILNEFYDQCNGPNWNKNDGWANRTGSVCNWYGVFCYKSSDHSFESTEESFLINKIDLSSNNVDCTNNNSINQIFELPGLKNLILNGNPEISFNLNFLSSINYAESSVLEILLLRNTKLLSLNGIENLPNLKSLDVSENRLTSIPLSIYQLKSLERLYLDQNEITGSLSSEIASLMSLKSIDVFDNQLTGSLPSQMMQLSNLEDAEFGRNQFTGSAQQIADIFANKDKLWGLFLSENAITGTLPTFQGYSNLIELNLEGNNLEGTINNNFLIDVPSNRANLKVFLGNNSLEGTLPEALGRIQSLFIDLKGNSIESIPGSLCEQKMWQHGDTQTHGCDAILCKPGTYNSLGRASNKSNGGAPLLCKTCADDESHVPFFGATSCDPHETLFESQETALAKFYSNCGGRKWKKKDKWLSDDDVCTWHGVSCHEKGLIDSIVLGNNNVRCDNSKDNINPLWELPRLAELWLYSNPLGAVDFSNVSKATHLSSLLLDSTGIKSIDGVGGAVNLKSLDVRFNAIEGSFPFELFSLTKLEELYMTSNNFKGPLPASFSSFGQLKKLRLDINDFTGSLPTMADLKHLKWLDFSANSLTGEIPSSFLENTAIEKFEGGKITVDLSDNMLSGVVPDELSRFLYLELYLKGNKFIDIDEALCAEEFWNEGNVNKYGCNAIMCPVGTYNSQGRQTSDSNECKECSKTKYMGSETCSRAKSLTGIMFIAAIIFLVTTFIF